MTGLTLKRDENKNPHGAEHKKCTSTPPIGARNVDFKDISNSKYLSSKGTNNVETVKKKLIIPLEPDLAENDEFMDIDPILHSSPVVDRLPKGNVGTGRLSRNKKVNKKREYTESPQCSLMKWAKPMKTMQKQDISDTGDNCVNNSKDSETSQENPAVSDNIAHRSRRTHRCLRDPDYLYADLKKKVTRKLNSSDDGSESTNEPSEIGSDMEDDDGEDLNPRKRRKFDMSPKKLNVKKVNSTSTVSTLKHSKMPLRLSRTSKRKVKVAQSQTKTATKTMHDFFGQKVKENLTQEEKDRQMAEQLQKQFELEAKHKLTSLRFKGTMEQYSLRTNHRKPASTEA